MAYASKAGRCVADVNNPISQSVCDRCGIWTPHNKMQFQRQWRGRQLANTYVFVCDTCLDVPAEFLKVIVIPPDPMPTPNARVEQFCADNVDNRTTSNPALPPVDFATSTNVILSGLQFIDGHQLQEGELVLVKSQTNPATNGIYKASTGVWPLQAYDNDKQYYKAASSIDIAWTDNKLRYFQLGMYLGAVYVARGAYTGQLFQINYADPSASVIAGAPVTVYTVMASTVNHYDLFTGIYIPGGDTRITENPDDFVRTTQQTGQAAGNINEIPGYSILVPGACQIGRENEVPYGCGTKQGLPPSNDVLPYSGILWPAIDDQSIPVWYSDVNLPSVWSNTDGIEVTFNNYFWGHPGPGAPWNPIIYSTHYPTWQNQPPLFPPPGAGIWVNTKCAFTLWHDTQMDNVNWAQVYPNAFKPNKNGPWPWGWL